jgi:Tannase-like family of unknown function (DUF6351)
MIRGPRERRRNRVGQWCRASAIVALAVLTVAPAFAADKLEIVSLSNRPDKLSGGDVLAMIRVPAGTSLGDVAVKLNGTDVTGVFFPDPANHALVGLVTGLQVGKNTLEAKPKVPALTSSSSGITPSPGRCSQGRRSSHSSVRRTSFVSTPTVRS